MTEQEMLNTLLDRICRLEVLYRRASDELMDLQSANDRLEGKYCNLLRALGLSAMSSVDDAMARIEGLEKACEMNAAEYDRLKRDHDWVIAALGVSGPSYLEDAKAKIEELKREKDQLVQDAVNLKSQQAICIVRLVTDEVGEVKEVRE